MSDTIHSFEDLKCWLACRVLRIFVAKSLVPTLPADERFRLKDPLLRAARSTTANIAEGYGRFHYLDNAKFCENAKGSCYEVLDHVIIGVDEGHFATTQLEETRVLVDSAVRITRGYTAYLRKANSSDSRINEDSSHYHTSIDPNPYYK